jgi:hypothetical protein
MAGRAYPCSLYTAALGYKEHFRSGPMRPMVSCYSVPRTQLWDKASARTRVSEASTTRNNGPLSSINCKAVDGSKWTTPTQIERVFRSGLSVCQIVGLCPRALHALVSLASLNPLGRKARKGGNRLLRMRRSERRIEPYSGLDPSLRQRSCALAPTSASVAVQNALEGHV